MRFFATARIHADSSNGLGKVIRSPKPGGRLGLKFIRCWERNWSEALILKIWIATSISFAPTMPTRSPSRGRTRSRSPLPAAGRSRSPSPSRSPRRSVSPRSLSRSRTPSDRARYPRRNGRGRSASLSRSRSPGRDTRRYRERSYSRGPARASTPPKSSKVPPTQHLLAPIVLIPTSL